MLLKRIFYFLLIASLAFTSCTEDEGTINKPEEPIDKTPEDFKVFKNIFDNVGVGAGVWLASDVIVLFDQTGNQYAWIENGVVMDKRSVEDAQSIFKSPQDDAVTAAVMSYSTLYLFQSTEKHYRVVKFDDKNVKGKWNDPDFFDNSNISYALTVWGIDNSCPFSSVSAAYGWHPDRSCSPIAKGEKAFLMDAKSARLSIYDGVSADFEGPKDVKSHPLYDCATDSNRSLGLDSEIDAAFVYPVNGKLYEVFFYRSGTEYIYSEIGSVEASEPINIII